MKKITCFSLLLAILSGRHCFAQQHGMLMQYHGTIGKRQVTVMMKVVDTIFTGSYYDAAENNLNTFSGVIHNQEVTGSETGAVGSQATFNGTASERFESVSGNWLRDASAVHFHWSAVAPEGSAQVAFISKDFTYEWRKNKNNVPLGCSAVYTTCYVTGAVKEQAMRRINSNLIDDDIEAGMTDEALQSAALDVMEDDFDSYVDEFDTAFSKQPSEETLKWMDEAPALYQWQANSGCNVLYDEHDLLCIRQRTYEFTGGAHGLSAQLNKVFSLKSGALLTPDSLLLPGSRRALTGLAQKALLKHFNATSLDQLVARGLLFQNTFVLNNNFFLRADGLGFTYNQYEIAPYSTGIIDLVIPWDQLRPLIRKEGALSWVLIDK